MVQAAQGSGKPACAAARAGGAALHPIGCQLPAGGATELTVVSQAVEGDYLVLQRGAPVAWEHSPVPPCPLLRPGRGTAAHIVASGAYGRMGGWDLPALAGRRCLPCRPRPPLPRPAPSAAPPKGSAACRLTAGGSAWISVRLGRCFTLAGVGTHSQSGSASVRSAIHTPPRLSSVNPAAAADWGGGEGVAGGRRHAHTVAAGRQAACAQLPGQHAPNSRRGRQAASRLLLCSSLLLLPPRRKGLASERRVLRGGMGQGQGGERVVRREHAGVGAGSSPSSIGFSHLPTPPHPAGRPERRAPPPPLALIAYTNSGLSS